MILKRRIFSPWQGENSSIMSKGPLVVIEADILNQLR